MQKRVNKHVRPDCSLLKGPTYEAGCWLAYVNLDFGRVLTTPRTGESGSRCLYCTDHTVHAEHLLPFWACQAEGAYVASAQRKPSVPSPTSFLGWQHFTHVVTLIARELGVSCVSPWKLVLDFPQTSPHVHFPLLYRNNSELWVQTTCWVTESQQIPGSVLKSPNTQSFKTQLNMTLFMYSFFTFLDKFHCFFASVFAIKESFFKIFF